MNLEFRIDYLERHNSYAPYVTAQIYSGDLVAAIEGKHMDVYNEIGVALVNMCQSCPLVDSHHLPSQTVPTEVVCNAFNIRDRGIVEHYTSALVTPFGDIFSVASGANVETNQYPEIDSSFVAECGLSIEAMIETLNNIQR